MFSLEIHPRRFDPAQARAKFGIYAADALDDDGPDEWIDLAGRAIHDDGALNQLTRRIDELLVVPRPA